MYRWFVAQLLPSLSRSVEVMVNVTRTDLSSGCCSPIVFFQYSQVMFDATFYARAFAFTSSHYHPHCFVEFFHLFFYVGLCTINFTFPNTALSDFCTSTDFFDETFLFEFTKDFICRLRGDSESSFRHAFHAENGINNALVSLYPDS